MRKRDHTALTAYVRRIADQFGLRDWTIDIHSEYLDADDTRAAVCMPIYGRKLAVVQFRANVKDDTPDEIRNTVVHELVHCHLCQVQSMLESDLEKVLPGKADVLFYRSFRRNVEFAVDGLATAVDRHFPLIVWPA